MRCSSRVALLSAGLVLWLAGAAVAGTPPPAPEPAEAPAASSEPPTGPSLRIQSARLRQDGADLRWWVRFSRDLPVAEIDPAKGRFICLVLGPFAPSHRRVCVSRRARGLQAKMTSIGSDGLVHGNVLKLHGARAQVDGAVLTLRASARSLRMKVGRPITWQALAIWRDGSACEQAPGACT